jgi:uncharacterized circularly permuted ATP-grasp superfamily protein
MTSVNSASATKHLSGSPRPTGHGVNGSTNGHAAQAGALFDSYLSPARPHAGAYDEMFAVEGGVRTAYRALYDSVAYSEAADLSARSEALGRAFVDQGITFSLSGQERPFPLDLIPRVIAAAEWTKLERGIIQRVRALEAFLADIYGDAHILRDGVLPRRLISSCAHFHREAVGFSPPNGVRIHVSGIDIVRDEAGVFRVLEDNLRCPSGVSYVMENRRTMARVFPDLFARHRVRAVGDYAVHLLRALRNAAAPNAADPTVVVLTPGVHNSAYFEHSLLARQMGVELAEGRDLFCRDNVVYLRTTEGERQVDVIYRRLDDEFLDPLHFRPQSVLGVAGLLNAARAGNVVIANAVGNGVGDDKLVYTYLPEIVKYYLGEKLLLPNVDTYRCWLPEECSYVLGHLDELVVKPVEGSGGYGIVFGPDATPKELAQLRKDVRANPRGWIAQPLVQLSTVPTKVGDKLAPRHVDLRPFAVNDGNEIFVLPGGLTRVALNEGSLIVNSSQGGGSKDTWVLAARKQAVTRELAEPGLVNGSELGGLAAEYGPELTASQQQQQQQQAKERALASESNNTERFAEGAGRGPAREEVRN